MSHMNRSSKKLWILLFLSWIFFVNCSSDSNSTTLGLNSTPDANSIQPATGFGGIVGKVVNAAEIWPEKNVYVYAAEFYGSREDGVFLLEPTKFPKTQLGVDLLFEINDIPPKNYLLLVGPNPEAAIFIKESGEPIIVEVVIGQINNVGSVSAEQ